MNEKIVTVRYEIDAMTDGVRITKDAQFMIEHTKTAELSELLEGWIVKIMDTIEITEALKGGGEK